MVPIFSSLQSLEVMSDDNTIHLIDYFVHSVFLYPQCARLADFLFSLLRSNAVVCGGNIDGDSSSGKYIVQTFSKSLLVPAPEHKVARNFLLTSSFYLSSCLVRYAVGGYA